MSVTITNESIFQEETISVINNDVFGEQVHYVNTFDDLPTPVNGVITFPHLSKWVFCDLIDILNNRVVCDGIVSIQGYSSETSALYASNLGAGQSLLTSSYTIPISFITLGCSETSHIFNLNADQTNGIDIISVNFGSSALGIPCGSLGTISNYSNVIFSTCAFLTHKDGITFSGTIGTIGINNSVFSDNLTSSKSHIYLPNGLTVTRRFRIIYSSLIVLSGNIGITYGVTPTIPNDGFILDTINFSGGSLNYISGITFDSIKTNWTNNIGIQNSYAGAQLYIRDNVVNTTFVSSGVFVLMAGTTILDTTHTSRFTMTDNYTLRYDGSKQITILVSVNSAISGGNAVTSHIVIAKNGTTIDSSEMGSKLIGAGNYINCSTSLLIEISNNDTISFRIRNDTNTTSILIHDLIATITRINN